MTGFAEALRNQRDVYPLLYRAAENAAALEESGATWEVLHEGERRWRNNVEQIFRHPFTVSQTALATGAYGGAAAEIKPEMLRRHLTEIEATIAASQCPVVETRYRIDEDGFMFPTVTTRMGGARFYLGRDPLPDDKLSLLVLRDLCFLETTNPGTDGISGEWLSEISLKVEPA